MKRYAIINPRSGKQIDGYELNIDDDSRVSIISYKHREPRILQLTLHTDTKGYQSYRVKLNGESFVVAQIVYSSVYRKEIGNDCVIHHKDLNPFNNAVENLVELPADEHILLHKMLKLHKVNKGEFNKLQKLINFAKKIIEVIN